MAKGNQSEAILGIVLATAALGYFYYRAKKSAPMGTKITLDPGIAADMISTATNLSPGKAGLVRLATRIVAERAAPKMGAEVGDI